MKKLTDHQQYVVDALKPQGASILYRNGHLGDPPSYELHGGANRPQVNCFLRKSTVLVLMRAGLIKFVVRKDGISDGYFCLTDKGRGVVGSG